MGGPTGSGKSWSCLSIAEETDPKFCIENVVFDARELMERINGDDLSSGSVIIFEEAGVSLSNRNWQSELNKIINYLFQTFRHRRLILLLNSPFMDFIDAATRKMFHAEFKTKGIDKKEQVTIIKPQLIQYNDRKDKFYYKWLRIKTAKGGVAPIKVWKVKKPSQEIIDAYEKKKLQFTTALNAQIEATLLEKKDKGFKRRWKCQSCNHEWQPKGKFPNFCPKCRNQDVIDVSRPISGTYLKKTPAPS